MLRLSQIMLEYIQNLKVNKIIQKLILVDLTVMSGWSLVDPVFAIFIIDRIQGATVVTIGFAAAIYWFAKSMLQMPVALMLDRIKGEKDDHLVLVLGLTLSSLAAISLIFITQIWQLYLIKLLQAIAFSLFIPSWYSLFSRHLDGSHRSFEFSLDSTVAGLAAGLTGLLSGVLVQSFGFVAIFFIAAALSLLAAIIIVLVPEIALPPRDSKVGEHMVGDHTPKSINK
ncbi:MAG: MFS transporter [Patescibacteria group bacterium]